MFLTDQNPHIICMQDIPKNIHTKFSCSWSTSIIENSERNNIENQGRMQDLRLGGAQLNFREIYFRLGLSLSSFERHKRKMIITNRNKTAVVC